MAKKTVKKDQVEDALPDALEQQELLGAGREFAKQPRFERFRHSLGVLRQSPPQSLLIEGGSVADRANASLYWAALLNCGSVSAQENAPCFGCPSCLHFFSRMHRDLIFFDGSAGNIKIDDVRAMRSTLGEPPREANARVIVLFEGQSLGDAAANALLKSLEEPKPGNSFVLTAPQRERLLPTLVSRSWVLTLPWPRSDELNQLGDELSSVSDWAKALLHFANTGQGWMERTSRRGNIDAGLALKLVLFCQNALTQAIAGRAAGLTPLAEAFCRLSPQGKHILNETLAECQDSLILNPSPVNPALVADWLATRVFFIFSKERIK